MVGTTVSHYKILEHLGGGGMGVVFKARDLKLDRFVALKFLPPELSHDPQAKHRFIHEAKAASTLQHTNICVVHDIDETPEGRMFIVMEYYEGESLKKKIERGPLKIDDAVNIAAQVAQGLARAHEQGITHRDIKPANIMITPDGVARIIDFGLAKLAGLTQLTKTGSSMGTAVYMSPEQARGETADQRTDIWSLGLVLYEMIAGHPPFRAEYENALVYSILNSEPEPLTALRTGVPVELERLVAKSMAKTPSERYQHLDDMLVDLHKILRAPRPAESGEHRVPVPGGKRRKARIAGIGAAAIAILVVVFLLGRDVLFDDAFPPDPIPVVVITFENQTGEASYDYLSKAIPNLLITSLEQSRYLRVVTWERMHDLLSQMGRADVSHIDKELGFELSRREGIEALVVGSFVKAGETFVTDVKVLDANSRELLESASARGNGAQSILDHQIDELSRTIGRGVGLSHRRISVSTEQITEVTTSSIEAYNFFLRGREEVDKLYYDQAIRFLQKAIALDSGFAMAYLSISDAYAGLANYNARSAALQRALDFSAKAGVKERLTIQARHARVIERNPLKQQTILKELTTRFPDEKRPHFNLASLYRIEKRFSDAHTELAVALRLDPNYAVAVNETAYLYADQGLYGLAIEWFSRYAALSPGDANPFDSMGEICLRMGRLEQSLSNYQKAVDVKPDFWQSYLSLAYVNALQERYNRTFDNLQKMIDASGHATIRLQGEYWRGWYQSWLGQPAAAVRTLNQVLADTAARGDQFIALGCELARAAIENDAGTHDRARKRLLMLWKRTSSEATFPVSTDIRFHALMGLFDIDQNRLDSARVRLGLISALMPKVEPRFGIDASSRFHLLEGELLIVEDSLDRAIAVLRSIPITPPPGSSTPVYTMYNIPFMHDALARAYVRKGETDSAIAEYRRLITIDSTDQDRRLIHPRYHIRLARLYEEKAEREMAISEYRRFLELWKNAEKDRPEPREARKRLAVLGNRTR
jgi:eukaryotic-like serine/threonine-protein kinase